MYHFLNFWKKGFVEWKEPTDRREYWMSVLIGGVLPIVALLIINAVLGAITLALLWESGPLKVIVGLFAGLFGFITFIAIFGVTVPYISWSKRRLEDAGFPWALVFLALIPILGGIAVIVMCCMPTGMIQQSSYPQTAAPNGYPPAPQYQQPMQQPMQAQQRTPLQQPVNRSPLQNNPMQQSAMQRPMQQPQVQRPMQQAPMQRPVQQPQVQPQVQQPQLQPAMQRPVQQPQVQPQVQQPQLQPAMQQMRPKTAQENNQFMNTDVKPL